MYDAALQFMRIAEKRSKVLERYSLMPRGYVLATVHRAENTDDPARLAGIFEALAALASDITVLVPPPSENPQAAGWTRRPDA